LLLCIVFVYNKIPFSFKYRINAVYLTENDSDHF
jgi:hypothetical protein